MKVVFTDTSVGVAVEPEIEAVMNWTQSHKFVTSVALHGGALVAKYPLNKPKPQGIPFSWDLTKGWYMKRAFEKITPWRKLNLWEFYWTRFIIDFFIFHFFPGGAWFTPDQLVFKDLAFRYTQYHSHMSERQLSPCTNQPGTIWVSLKSQSFKIKKSIKKIPTATATFSCQNL